jgi:hypothetical protein
MKYGAIIRKFNEIRGYIETISPIPKPIFHPGVLKYLAKKNEISSLLQIANKN